MMTKKQFNEQFRENKNIGMRSNYGTSKWVESQILRVVHKAMAVMREEFEEEGYFIIDEKWEEMWLKLAESARENYCISEYGWNDDYVWAETEVMDAEDLEKEGILIKPSKHDMTVWERVHKLIDKFNEEVVIDWGPDSKHSLKNYSFIPKNMRDVRLNKEQFHTLIADLMQGFRDNEKEYEAMLCDDLLWDLRS